MTPCRIVFVTVGGTLGDEEVFLLYFLRWLRRHTEIDAEVLAWEDGPLLDEIRQVAPVLLLADLNQWRPARLAEVLRCQRVAQVLKGLRLRWWLHRRRRADVLYVNGLSAARILGFVTRTPPSVVVHVHGTADFERSPLTTADRAQVAALATKVVASSDEAANRCRSELGVPDGHIVHHDYFVATGGAGPLTSADPPSRGDLGIPADAFVVGGVGTADWWDEPEQFVLFAWRLRRDHPDLPVRFVWIAPDLDARRLWPLQHDLANAGVADKTSIVGGHRPLDHLAVMDVLVLSSRHAPHELLAHEAAGAGVVVVSTDNLHRPAAADGVVTVPYLDIPALSDAVSELASGQRRRQELVEAARRHAAGRHDVTVGAPRLLESLFHPT